MGDQGQDLTAAELALGILDGEERAAAMRRVLSDRTFAAEVETWREHFGSLFAQWPEVRPPETVRDRLIGSLFPPPPRSRIWPAAVAASLLVAASVSMVLLLRPDEVPRIAAGPTLVAVLKVAQGQIFPAVYQADAGQIRIPAMGPRVPGRSEELWMIGRDGVPHSLGVMDASKPAVVTLSHEARGLMAPGITLAVSREPGGGSPTGLPTGPILASGAFISV